MKKLFLIKFLLPRLSQILEDFSANSHTHLPISLIRPCNIISQKYAKFVTENYFLQVIAVFIFQLEIESKIRKIAIVKLRWMINHHEIVAMLSKAIF